MAGQINLRWGARDSLIKMAHGGFPVPPGMVLGVHFFDEWLEELNAHEDLRLLETDSQEILQSKTAALQQAAGRLGGARFNNKS